MTVRTFLAILLMAGAAAMASAQSPSVTATILDSRGTGSWAGQKVPRGQTAPVKTWLLSEADSSYEMSINGGGVTNGAVRLLGRCAFLIETNRPWGGLQFRLFSGQADFYLPHTDGRPIFVLTPAGTVVTFGAEFTVSVSVDNQVALACRKGRASLTGSQNGVAQPGWVIVGDRLGRDHRYAIPLDQVDDFMDHWQEVTTDDAPPILRSLLSQKLLQWKARSAADPEQTRSLALWFWKAQPLLSTGLPDSADWMEPLLRPLSDSGWEPPLAVPGPFGELL